MWQRLLVAAGLLILCDSLGASQPQPVQRRASALAFLFHFVTLLERSDITAAADSFNPESVSGASADTEGTRIRRSLNLVLADLGAPTVLREAPPSPLYYLHVHIAASHPYSPPRRAIPLADQPGMVVPVVFQKAGPGYVFGHIAFEGPANSPRLLSVEFGLPIAPQSRVRLETLQAAVDALFPRSP